ncbi:hypothetical protein OJ997_12650 [Solirubrobacter phytolaccae]|uniref:Uncharacterized protein n=1 Tax=Solirubrobacter phytolaccae TaxID=1404360 RepID=A0A9X3N7G6_9ACTN|nr:hypothetical protein [Solirubrobacter phytolaccae]MDA0181148.1 hypothetical protein [Solirubrobacter phytolaccae]
MGSLGLEARPTQHRRALELSAIALTPLVGFALLFAGGRATTALVTDFERAPLLWLTIASLAFSVAHVLTGNIGRWASVALEGRIVEFLLAREQFQAVYPVRERTASELIEERLPLKVRWARDTLEDLRPARWTRWTACTVSALVEASTVAVVVRDVIAGGRPSLWLVISGALALGVFSITWFDLARGQSRKWRQPRTVVRWGARYAPERLDTIIPSASVLAIVAGPLLLAYLIATAPGLSASQRVVAAGGGLLATDLVWDKRTLLRAGAWCALERRTVWISTVVAGVVARSWTFLRGLAFAGGAASLATWAIFLTASPAELAASPWLDELATLFVMLALGPVIILMGWRRPRAVHTVNGAELMDRYEDSALERRLGAMIHWARWLAIVSLLAALFVETGAYLR